MKKGDETKKRILEAGVTLWSYTDQTDVTARKIAAVLQISHQAILYHYPTHAVLKDAVATHAVQTGQSRVIAQLITINHKAVEKMTKNERTRYLSAL